MRLIALLAVALLVATVMLFRRRKSSGRAAAIICLVVSIGLHLAMLIWVPRLSTFFSGGGVVSEQNDAPGSESVSVSVFDPDMKLADFSDLDSLADELDPWEASQANVSSIAPLTLSQPIVDWQSPEETTLESETESGSPDVSSDLAIEPPPATIFATGLPASLASSVTPTRNEPVVEMDDPLGDWLDETLAGSEPQVERESPQPPQPVSPVEPAETAMSSRAETPPRTESAASTESSQSARASIPGQIDEDFATRQGAAKTEALHATGGDASTEAAVAAALKFLSANQRADGAWDPLSSGAGRERAPLGLQRGSAGKRAATGITGLALLALLGNGNTHQSGDYHDNVYRGLVYLLGQQKPDGSLAGDASVYAAHYCHAMAGLSLAECSAMTEDAAAIEATRRALAYSKLTQHPVTGGWRYTRGDAGDMSQLGWQAMLIDGGRRSGALAADSSMQAGVARFLATVRSGRAGGLASYRPGERPTATMTAEALATRLLIGEKVPADTIGEAEGMLLADLPGRSAGPDNYYYWYYATLALHQLQDDAWRTWNDAMKQRLLATQRPDGSWPDTTLWGGYGGTVYTTAMATLCLETYYRHQIRR